jgi:hypothetical protein
VDERLNTALENMSEMLVVRATDSRSVIAPHEAVAILQALALHQISASLEYIGESLAAIEREKYLNDPEKPR